MHGDTSPRSQAGEQPCLVKRLVVRKRGIMHVIQVDDIEWIEAANYYVRVHCGTESYLVRRTLTRLLRQLDPVKFVRVHRSAVVNIDRIKLVLPRANGEIVLSSGVRVPLSRRQRPHLERLLRTGM